MIRNFFIYLILFTASLSPLKAEIDKYYVRDLSEKFTFRPYFSHYNMTFNYIQPDSIPNVTYKPNTTFDLGLGFSHRWLSIGYSFAVARRGDPKTYGVSKSFDIQGDVYVDKSIIQFAYQNYKGYYATKGTEWFPTIVDSVPNIVRPDMHTHNIALGYMYIFNGNKLSFRSIFSQSQWQVHSAGSFLIGGGLSVFIMNADSSITSNPNPSNDPKANETNFQSGYFIAPSIKFGYAYNLIIMKHISIMGAALPGLSYGYSDYEIKGGKPRSDMNFNFQGQLRYGVLYNSRYFFGGFNGVTDIYSHQILENRFFFVSHRLELFAGFRFRAPKFICKKCR
jgi:Domain of unknown function (DUF4421)